MSRLCSLPEFHSEFMPKATLSVILCILITCPFIFFILLFPSQVSRAPGCCCSISSQCSYYVIAQFCPTLLKEFLVWSFTQNFNMLSLVSGQVTYFWRMLCHPEEPGQTEEVHLWEPHEVHKAKCKVLPLGWGKPQCHCRQEAGQRDLTALVDERLGARWQCALAAQ